MSQDRTAPSPASDGAELGRLWVAEDWWSALLGLAFVLLVFCLYGQGISATWLMARPDRWASLAALGDSFAAKGVRFAIQYVVMLGVFGAAAMAMGRRLRDFAVGFTILYLLALVALTLGVSPPAGLADIDTPVIALLLGLFVANVIGLPRAFDVAFRVEFYVMAGIVLVGASFPASLVSWNGITPIFQAAVISLVTFAVIFAVARFLELDRRLAAMLAAGGAICGVSAVVVVAGAVRARREDIPVAVGVVVIWAIVMIVALPLLAQAWYLPPGVAGAWIGSSQFTDAAGFATVQTYGALERNASVAGATEQATIAFVMMKVLGRDMWIGIWAVVLSFVAASRWSSDSAFPRTAGGWIAGVWHRFPKFVLAFILCSLLVTWAAGGASFREFNATLKPVLVAPMEGLRTWLFTFSFLSIGLTARIRGFGAVTGNALAAFSAGVVVNLVLGFLFSAWIFRSHWQNLAP